MTRGYYRITGSWDDPQVKRIDAQEMKDDRQVSQGSAMSQPIVAAVQMTSLADVAQNLATTRRLLAEARGARRLPCRAARKFLLHGPQRSGAARGRRAGRRRARAGGGSAMARELQLWVVAGTQPIAVEGDSRPANACVVYDDGWQARRAIRQDPPVRRRPAGRPRGLSRVGQCRAWCKGSSRRYARGPARADRVLRFALPRTVPPTRFGGCRNLQRAVRIHEPDRSRALGDAAAGTGHREPLLRGCGRAERNPRQQPGNLRR